jgi:hypothetical protein
MNQVSTKLRRTDRGYAHWCPACGEMHTIFDNWQFDGNLEVPTFTPSVKITGVQAVVDERGDWTGEWIKSADGRALPLCCHYFLKAGQLEFCGDCTHALSGQTVPLPDLPPHLRDAA